MNNSTLNIKETNNTCTYTKRGVDTVELKGYNAMIQI